MSFKGLGWFGFIFFGAGLLVLLFGPDEWKPYGCGALLTAATLYGTGLVLVARHIARIRRQMNDMLARAADEMDRRKGGGKKVIDAEKVEPNDEERLN
jgi:hypothetical protein